MLLGTTQHAYSIGIFGIAYTIGMVIGFLLLAAGVAGKLRNGGEFHAQNGVYSVLRERNLFRSAIPWLGVS